MKAAEKKKTLSIVDIIIYIVFTAFAFICVYPFYYVLINTISDNVLVNAGAIKLFPKGIHFKNYIEVFQIDNIVVAARNTLVRTIVGTVSSVGVTTYLAYFFTKQNLWGRKFWYRFTIVTMYFGAGMIPVYLNIRDLGLLNTFWVYLVPGIINVYNMILVKTYIESLPPELEEAAQIDGAGYMTRLIKVIFPLCTPILATISLWTAVRHWNSYMDNLLYITDKKYNTLQYVLQMFFREAAQLAKSMQQGILFSEADLSTQMTPTSIKFTITALVTIPILCVYPFVQRFFIKGLMVGSVKG